MGSLSRPNKAPTIQPYVPPSNTSTETVSTSEPVKSESELAAESREESLLRRSRGRFGTILTGFKGFLNSADKESGRKTLLGE